MVKMFALDRTSVNVAFDCTVEHLASGRSSVGTLSYYLFIRVMNLIMMMYVLVMVDLSCRWWRILFFVATVKFDGGVSRSCTRFV